MKNSPTRILSKVKRLAEESFFSGDKSPFTRDLVKRDDCIIGEYTYGYPEILAWDEGKKLTVGKFCSFADNVTIFLGGGHRTDWITTYPFNVLNKDFPNGVGITGHPISKGDVTIGNDVWIGRGSSIMSGICIGDGAVVGAGSIVTKDVPAYSIFAGNPATFRKKRFSDSDIEFLINLKWWDWPIEKINENVHLLCSGNIDSLKLKFQ